MTLNSVINAIEYVLMYPVVEFIPPNIFNEQMAWILSSSPEHFTNQVWHTLRGGDVTLEAGHNQLSVHFDKFYRSSNRVQIRRHPD
jgi:hypothetical protein